MSTISATIEKEEPRRIGSKTSQLDGLRVAIVHHWFVSMAGGERVVNAIAGMFPQADIFTLVLDKRKLPPQLRERKITASFLDRTLIARRAHRHFLPFYPLAVEMLDVSGYDLVITSDSGPMKGVVTDLESTHICYCHSPMRYLWDAHSAYLREMSPLVRTFFGLASHYVRNWDYSAAQRVDHFLANSNYVAGRIRKYYRRESTVIHPPITTSRGFLADQPEDYYLAVGRLVPYKRTDILIDACELLGRKLVIIGDGPELKTLQKRAGKNVRFIGEVDEQTLSNSYAHCRALLFAADEDFGMVPLEAQSHGRPVIAYGKGGSLETVAGVCPPIDIDGDAPLDGTTGMFFQEQTPASLAQTILNFEAIERRFVPEQIQAHAREFDESVFVERLGKFIERAIANQEDR
jgi:glycosyltransferase involved in cell wall biosynthesis